jgi:hypothetical protein
VGHDIIFGLAVPVGYFEDSVLLGILGRIHSSFIGHKPWLAARVEGHAPSSFAQHAY